MKKVMPMVCLALLAACTTPADVSQPLAAGGDKNAKFDIKDSATGFTVDLRYSRYQFVPEADVLLVACRSIATTRAYEEGKASGQGHPADQRTDASGVHRPEHPERPHLLPCLCRSRLEGGLSQCATTQYRP
ncbi:hypothetical protein [Sphingobium yanoikuyae]|uniref:hypothetical protein n=1 Tax=Sphingobium yanoikuyae TaxID=13690 RepID=UPI0012D2E01F|nr:hypothetical protein [Sphingobium yanoikuyae]MDV3478618.1 hypothetical protein [Sphingobium yanoikuyae]